ncbi:hypothetical protein Tco_0948375, partial [Tanacetum coccineum]
VVLPSSPYLGLHATTKFGCSHGGSLEPLPDKRFRFYDIRVSVVLAISLSGEANPNHIVGAAMAGVSHRITE